MAIVLGDLDNSVQLLTMQTLQKGNNPVLQITGVGAGSPTRSRYKLHIVVPSAVTLLCIVHQAMPNAGPQRRSQTVKKFA
jgi:hypothetical protein